MWNADERLRMQEMVDRHARELGEHFDAVHILCSHTDSDGTAHVSRGCGNWFARQGMAHEFIGLDRADEVATRVAQRLSRPDEGDDWKAKA